MNTNINKLEAIIVVVVMSQSAGYSGTEVGTCQEPHTGGIRQDVLDPPLVSQPTIFPTHTAQISVKPLLCL